MGLNGGEIMRSQNYYQLCHNNIGKMVEVRTRDGQVHQGVIHQVDRQNVYLRRLPQQRQFGGFSYGNPGWGNWGYGSSWGRYGSGWDFIWGIAIGAITALVFF